MAVAAYQAGPPALTKAQRAVTGAVQIRSVSLEGTMRSGFINEKPPSTGHEQVIQFLLPTHYRRSVTNNAIGIVTQWGFARGVSLRASKSLRAGTMINSAAGGADVPEQRAEAARLLLGLLADTRGVVAMTASAGATASSLRFLDPTGKQYLLELDPTTALPAKLVFRDKVLVQPPADMSKPPGQRQLPPSLEEVEVALLFGDRRPVNGVSIPHRITLTHNGAPSEEFTVQRVRMNDLTPADFIPPKSD